MTVDVVDNFLQEHVMRFEKFARACRLPVTGKRITNIPVKILSRNILHHQTDANHSDLSQLKKIRQSFKTISCVRGVCALNFQFCFEKKDKFKDFSHVK